VNWALTLLGVAPDTDVSGVKRAYARLLRSTRPDEDPEAFQRLHTAYQLVLAHANGRQVSVAAPTTDIPPPASPGDSADPALDVHVSESTDRITRTPSTGDASTPWQPSPAARAESLSVANPLELVSRVIHHAVATNDESALSWWLSTQPEFWSIRIKQHTGQLLLQQLFREPQPMASTCLDALLQFFDLQQVLSGVNPIALVQLRQRQLALWYVLPENHRALALRLNIPTNRSPDPRPVQACLSLLYAPLRWHRVLWPAIRRHQTATVARLIHGLCGGQFADLPARIERQHAEFWYRAAQLGQFSWPRFAVGSVRAAFLALIVMVGMASITALSSWSQGSATEWYASLGIAAIMAAGSFSVWLVYAAWMWLDFWQGLPESATSANTWLRRALIPMLCATSLALDYLAKAPLLAGCATVPILVLALRRYHHRSPPRAGRRNLRLGSSLPGVGFLLIVLANAASRLQLEFFDHIPLVAIAVSATVCIWLADMWRHRRYFRTRATT
jgi:hypothetical protein